MWVTAQGHATEDRAAGGIVLVNQEKIFFLDIQAGSWIR